MNGRRLIAFLIVGVYSVFFGSVAYASVLQGFQGGSGYGSASSSDVGKALIVASTSPYLTYTFGTAGGGVASTSPFTSGQIVVVSGTAISTNGFTTSDFLPSSTQYIATNTGNWAGTWQTFSPSHFLSTSTASTTYVPYTGANANVDLGSHTLSVSGISNTGNVTTTSENITSQLTVGATSTFNGIIIASGTDNSGSDIVGSFANNGLQLGAQPNSTSTMYIGSNMIQVYTGGPYELCLNGNTSGCADFDTSNLTFTNKTYSFPNFGGTFALVNATQTWSGTQTITNLKVTPTSSILATDANGNVVATTTSGGSLTAVSSTAFGFITPTTTGNYIVSGLSFKPSILEIHAIYSLFAGSGPQQTQSDGTTNGSSTATIWSMFHSNNGSANGTSTYIINLSGMQNYGGETSTLVSFNSDGFTLNFGSYNAGPVITYRAYK